MLTNMTRVTTFLSKAVTNDFSERENTATPEPCHDVGGKLNEEQKCQIAETVRVYCPRVTSQTSDCWGMFATPEANGEVTSFYDPIPYLKMIIEIIKYSRIDCGFCHKEGQRYANRCVQTKTFTGCPT